MEETKEEATKEAEEGVGQTALEKRGNEISEGKIGKVAETKYDESPLEQVTRLNKETKEMLVQFLKLREGLDRTLAEMQLAGRGFAGSTPKELTKEEKAQEEADKIIKLFK